MLAELLQGVDSGGFVLVKGEYPDSYTFQVVSK